MARILYSVTATFIDQATAGEFLEWLRAGHIADVIKAGAESGAAIRLDSTDGRPRIMAQYTFASRAALDRYIAEDAPRLRAEGLAKFPASRGVTFERGVGTIEHAEGGV
jgi:hypothetical protein